MKVLAPEPRSRARAFALVLLLPASAWLASSTAHAVAAPRLGEDVVPTAQALRLRLDPASAGYDGSTAIELEVRRAVATFRFHAAGEAFQKVALSDAAGHDVAIENERQGDVVTVRAKSDLVPGRYRLAIEFSQPFNTRAVSLYRVAVAGEAYLFTQFEEIEARGAFPCFDEPAFKIPWSVTLDVPERDLALGNMSVAKEEARDGRKTVTFKTSPPLPSYLVALAVGPFDTVPIPGLSVPGRIVTVKGQRERAAMAAELTPGLLGALEGYFARPYPYDKLDLVAVPDFAYGAMENAGAITFAESVLLVDPGASSQEARARLLYVTTHEIAHMWFGDLVTMRWWNDLWLNESFADWMANKIAMQVAPELDFDIAQVEAANRAMRNDASPHAKPVRLPDDCAAEEAFENVGQAYAKGRGVLGMVESWIGAETFRKGILAYLDEHAWANADANDLWRALAKVSGQDVVTVLGGFMQQPGVPRIDVRVESGGRVALLQERFHRAKEALPAISWRVPIVLSFADDNGPHRVATVLTKDSDTVDLGAHGALRWLSPNAGAQGYYRWHLEADELDRLLAARAVLSRTERVALLGNLRALLDAGTFDGGQWIHTLAAFATDDQAVVAAAVVDAVAPLETPFATGATAPLYAEFVRGRFGEAARSAGWGPVPGQSAAAEALRQSQLALVGGEGEDHQLRAAARALALRWLANEPVAIDPALLPTLLELAARDGDRALFERYRERLTRATVPTERRALLGGLGAFDDPTLATAALDFALTDAVRSSETVAILGGAAAHELGRERAWRWLQGNWTALAAKVPPPVVSFLPRFASGCSPERLAEARVFFATKSVPGLEDSLNRVADTVEACLELRRGQGAAVEAALRQEIRH